MLIDDRAIVGLCHWPIYDEFIFPLFCCFNSTGGDENSPPPLLQQKNIINTKYYVFPFHKTFYLTIHCSKNRIFAAKTEEEELLSLIFPFD